MKVSLFLMTKKGFHVLNSLVYNDMKSYIELVIIGEDKNIVDDYANEIKQLCEENKIKYTKERSSVRITTAFALTISWRWLIPTDEGFQLIVLHDSLLPKYRGFSPLVNSLINGEKEIGVTAIIADKQFDRGDIIAQEKVTINYPIKINEAIDLITVLYSKLTISIIQYLANGVSFEAVVQKEEDASYSVWRDEDDYKINWNKDAKEIKRFIDAVSYPYKGAFTFMDGNKVIVADAYCIEDLNIENRDVGKILFNDITGPIVICAKGLLKVTKLTTIEGTDILPIKKFRTRFKNE
jgi:methionyl-tRNA formyltransferase